MILGFIVEVFNFLIWSAIAVGVTYLYGYLTKKEPEDIKSEPDTFKLPTIQEGTKFPIIAGTCWQEAPIIAWFGDINTDAIKVRLTGTDQYVYVNKYYYGALHILTQGFNDGIKQVKLGDIVIWPTFKDSYDLGSDGETYLYCYDPDLYGGIREHNGQIKGQGGISFRFYARYGLPTQSRHSYIKDQLGSILSADRGLTTTVLKECYIGTTTQVRLVKYLIKRTEHLTSGENQWYSSKASIRTNEINPIHWLREMYTDTEWGLGTPTAYLNDTNLKAAADTLYDEDFGICIKWEGEQSLENHIKDVLRYINAIIYENHETGLIEIKLIRDDYDVGTLEEFDESDIIVIEEFSRPMFHKIPNVTHIKYWNMYRNLPVTASSPDTALCSAQGGVVIPNNVSYTGIVNSTLAGRLAARDQQQISACAASMKIKGKRTMSHLKPGDVFKVSFASHKMVSVVVRVMAAHYGTLMDGAVTFDCIEDVFGMKDSIYADPPDSLWSETVDDPVYDEDYLVAVAVSGGTDPTVTTT